MLPGGTDRRRSPSRPRLPRAARWAPFAALAVALSACFLLPADGDLGIQGSIVSAKGEPINDCTLYLRPADTGDSSFQSEDVSATFDTGFVVSPTKESYFITISCPGYPQPYRSKVFTRSGAADERPVDLGVVVMKN